MANGNDEGTPRRVTRRAVLAGITATALGGVFGQQLATAVPGGRPPRAPRPGAGPTVPVQPNTNRPARSPRPGTDPCKREQGAGSDVGTLC